MTRKLFTVIAVVLLISMAAFAGCMGPQDGDTVTNTTDVDNIRKIHFKDEGVVCFIYEEGESGGLSCFTEEELQGDSE